MRGTLTSDKQRGCIEIFRAGWVEDLHLLTAEHAQHTTKPLRGNRADANSLDPLQRPFL